MDKIMKTLVTDKYEAKIKQLEDDIKEYKKVIDSYKDKLDVSECLYEDEKIRVKQLEEVIEEALTRVPANRRVFKSLRDILQKALKGQK